MKHSFEQKVFYSDTDAYGVVWHGAYLRWLEAGRVLLCESLGHNLSDLTAQDILLPVVNINIRYKASARLDNIVIIETVIEKCNPLSVTFKQTVKDKFTDKTYIEAAVDVVAIHNDGKLYRRMPDILAKSFSEAILCCV